MAVKENRILPPSQAFLYSHLAGDLSLSGQLNVYHDGIPESIALELRNNWSCTECKGSIQYAKRCITDKSSDTTLFYLHDRFKCFHSEHCGDVESFNCTIIGTARRNQDNENKVKALYLVNSKQSLINAYLCGVATWRMMRECSNKAYNSKRRNSEALYHIGALPILPSKASLIEASHKLKSTPVYLATNLGMGISPPSFTPMFVKNYFSHHGHIALGEPGTQCATTYTIGADLYRGRFVLDSRVLGVVHAQEDTPPNAFVFSEEIRLTIDKMVEEKSIDFETEEEFHRAFAATKQKLAEKYTWSAESVTEERIAKDTLSVIKGRKFLFAIKYSEIWESTLAPVGVQDLHIFRSDKRVGKNSTSGVRAIDVIISLNQQKLAQLYLDEKLLRAGMGLCPKKITRNREILVRIG